MRYTPFLRLVVSLLALGCGSTPATPDAGGTIPDAAPRTDTPTGTNPDAGAPQDVPGMPTDVPGMPTDSAVTPDMTTPPDTADSQCTATCTLLVQCAGDIVGTQSDCESTCHSVPPPPACTACVAMLCDASCSLPCQACIMGACLGGGPPDGGPPGDGGPAPDAAGDPCTSDFDCFVDPDRTVCDVSAGYCVECNTRSDCGDPSLHCSAAHTCLSGCATDSDCAGNPAGGICNTAANACVRCVTGRGCPARQYCDTTAGYCTLGCGGDVDCVGTTDGVTPTPHCATSSVFHACQQCVIDSHCPVGNVCSYGRCVGGCNAASPCPTGQTCCSNVCVNTAVSTYACGGCGTVCTSMVGTVPTCTAGTCGRGACLPSRGDCDGMASNGCETDLSVTLASCGACGMACPSAPNADPTCSGGACGLACHAGYGNCDGMASNGCEATLNTDVNHCGGCGTVCHLPNATTACAAGACTVAACATGYADCDHRAANGCESATASDNANCGACGHACAADQVCSAGTCTAACGTGLSFCATSTGHACSNTAADPRNCGACGTVCNLANAAMSGCAASACTVVSCTAGHGDCDHRAGNGCEADVTTDVANCGACGHGCSGGQTCTAGVCVCPTGRTFCGGVCVTTASDATNCGVCGHVCTLPNATPACMASACAVAACSMGYADCDHDPANGCEAALATDPANCGGCGMACAGTCLAGVCHSDHIVYSDGFESGSADWTLDPTWTRVMSGSAGMWGLYGAPPVPRYPDACGINGRATLHRDVSLAGAISASVRFHSQGVLGSLDTIEVLGSGDSGTTWVSLGHVSASSGYTTVNLDLTRFAGRSTVRVAFRFDNECPDCCTASWHIDEVEIHAS